MEDEKAFVFKLCEGGGSFERIKMRKHFTETQMYTMIVQALQTVNYLHALGIVQHDLKP